MTTNNEQVPVEQVEQDICPDRDVLWSDAICKLVDAAFETVSRNPSGYEEAIAYRRAIVAAATTARNDALEEAAKVAGEFEHQENGRAYDKRQAGRDDNFNCARASAAAYVASAIRSLKSQPSERGHAQGESEDSSMTTPDPALIAAREIAAERAPNAGSKALILEGAWDKTSEIQAARLAITQTEERIVAWLRDDTIPKLIDTDSIADAIERREYLRGPIT